MKKDIQNREDLFVLMNAFYDKLLADPSISYLFTDVAKIDIKDHLPVIVDFWDMVLFESDTYRKNAIEPHIRIHQQSPIKKQHFQTWLGYFKQTIDEFFEGDKAELAKQRAMSIANIMQIKLKTDPDSPDSYRDRD